MEIKVNNLSSTYANQNIFKNICTKFEDHTINFIIGLNRHLFLKILSGDYLEYSGNIAMDNLQIDKESSSETLYKWKKNIGYVGMINTNITVKKLILSNLDKYGYNKDRDKHLNDALKMVHLDKCYLDNYLEELSSGEKKLALMASVLAYNPKIILIDENMLSLDFGHKTNLIKIIRILKNRFHKTIIILSNDTNLIHKLADFIYVIEKNDTIQKFDKYALFTDEKKVKKYHLEVPKVINFSNLVLKNKNVKLGFRDDINDLLKDIYRYAKKW